MLAQSVALTSPPGLSLHRVGGSLHLLRPADTGPILSLLPWSCWLSQFARVWLPNQPVLPWSSVLSWHSCGNSSLTGSGRSEREWGGKVPVEAACSLGRAKV